MCAGAATFAATAKLDLCRSQGARNCRHKGVVEGALVAAPGALSRLTCVAPLFYVELWAVGIDPDTDTSVRFKAFEGDAGGVLHRDLELF